MIFRSVNTLGIYFSLGCGRNCRNAKIQHILHSIDAQASYTFAFTKPSIKLSGSQQPSTFSRTDEVKFKNFQNDFNDH